MKVRLTRKALAGTIEIPAGEYMVALQSDVGVFNLAGGGKDYKVPATRRRRHAKTRVTTIQFYSGGGKLWSLVLVTPKHGEWIAVLEYI